MLRRMTRLFGTVLAALLLAAVGLPTVAAATTQPVHQRTFGSVGQTEMNPGGLDVDAAGNLYVVNTGNRTIAKYPAGQTVAEWVVGDLGAPVGQGGFFEPRDIAVVGGKLYVAEPNGRVQVLGLDGAFLRLLSFPFRVPIGVSGGVDAAGDPIVLVSDGSSGKVEVFDLADNHVVSVPKVTPNSGTRDAATDSAGNIYVADYRGNQVLKYAPDGTTLLTTWDGGSTGTCAGMKLPYGVAVDVDDNVYVAESSTSRIAVYDTDGTCLGRIGSRGTGPFQYENLRRVAVGRGADPLVYGADLWGRKILVHHRDGTLATPGRIGDPTIPPAGVVNRASSIAVSDDGVFVTDLVNHRIAAWDHDGTNPRVFGEKGKATLGQTFNWPQGIGISPVDGVLWVGDTHSHRVRRFQPDGTPIDVIGNRVGTAPLTFNWPMGTAFDAAGNAYVVDHLNDRVQKISPSKQHLWTSAPFNGEPTGVAVDEARNRVLVVDHKHHVVRIFRLGDGASLGTLSIPQGTAEGQLRNPRGIALEADGTIWISELARHRVQAFEPDGTWTGVVVGGPWRGTADGKFNNPHALAIHDGELYVADSFNHRVQVFSLGGGGGPGPGDDTTPPVGSISAPADGATVPGPDVLLEGMATDDVGVDLVEVAIKDRTTNQWLRADGSWGGFQRLEATLANPGATSTGWSFAFAAPAGGGDFGFGVTATDASGNVHPAPRPWHVFTVTDGGPGDVAPPEGGITSPAGGSTVTDRTVVVTGTAVDDVAVDLVEVVVRDVTAGTWLRADGSFGGYQRHPADVTPAGGADTTWTFTFEAPADGEYGVGVIVTDATGKDDPAPRPWNRFTVDAGSPPPPPPPPPGGEPQLVGELSDPAGIAPLYPAGAVVAPGGELYVANSGGDRVSRVATDGTITDVDTTGWNRPRAIALDDDPTRLWVADTGNNRLVHVGTDGTRHGVIAAGALQAPFGVAADATGVYVADTYNNRLVKLTDAGAQLWQATTCFGTAISRPRGVGQAADGSILVADTDNHRVLRLAAVDGACLQSMGGFGSAAGKLKRPQAVIGDGVGGVYVADLGNNRVQHLDATGASLAMTTTGVGSAPGQLRSMDCLYLDGDDVGVCDTFQYRITVFTDNGATLDHTATIGGTPPAGGGFNQPFGVAYAPDGALYVSDMFNHRMQRFNPDLTFDREWGGRGSALGRMTYPRGVEVSPDGSRVVLANSENNRIDVYDPQGNLLDTVQPNTGSAMRWSYQGALAADGSHWVADTNRNRVLHLAANGDVLGSFSGDLQRPRGIAIAPGGDLVVSNSNLNRVQRYAPDGTLVATLATVGSGPGQVRTPSNVTIVGTGPTALVYVADSGNDRIVVLQLDGTPVHTFGEGELDTPRSVSVNPVDGTIAVADWNNDRVTFWR